MNPAGKSQRSKFSQGKYLEFSIEFDSGMNVEIRALYGPELVIEDGALLLPAEPGWGLTIHPEWLKKADYQLSELS